MTAAAPLLVEDTPNPIDKIEHLAKFGGVRIEDEVHCTSGSPENLTRDAFAELT